LYTTDAAQQVDFPLAPSRLAACDHDARKHDNMMNDTPRHDAPSTGEPQRCTRCGAAFHCGARAGDASCWCAALPALPAERLRDGAGCLCAACLTAELGELARASRET
jgi:hypothetical protein